MEQQRIRLYQHASLPAGRLRLPDGIPERRISLRFGCAEVQGIINQPAPAGEVHLAPDLWKALTIPFSGIQLYLRHTAPDRIDLGPTVAVLYPGKESFSRRGRADRADLYYGHLQGEPGLLALGFDGEIDWKRRRIFGYTLDNRPGREGELVRGWFPIPAAVRLTWSIRRDVIQQLRELTENRTFNWVRSIGKWQFHTLLSADPELRQHLPETRLLKGPSDLASMLVRHETLFVKHTHGIKGKHAAQVRRGDGGFTLRHLRDGAQVERAFTSLNELMPALRQITGKGRCVVQQGIANTGLEGRPLHFRVVPVRQAGGRWRLAAFTACVARDEGAVFTNLANGATDQDVHESLERHYGMSPDEARQCAAQMVDLCLTAAARLDEAFYPLGLLGFDVLVEKESRQILLLEANAVPGWGYPDEIEKDLARSQIDLAWALTGFAPPEGR